MRFSLQAAQITIQQHQFDDLFDGGLPPSIAEPPPGYSACSAKGLTLTEIAGLLRRSEAEVQRKALELEL